MTQVQDLLDRRADGWESDEEEAGQGLYYTEKQTRVFKAIVENQNANLQEVADEAGVHPSYVRYIVNRLPRDRAADDEWLMDKAGVTEEDLEEADEVPEDQTEEEPPEEETGPEEEPPEQPTEADPDEEILAPDEQVPGPSEEEVQGRGGEVMKSFGIGQAPEEEPQQEATDEGYEVTMTRMLPVTISVTVPYDMLEVEAQQKAEEAQKIMNQVDPQ